MGVEEIAKLMGFVSESEMNRMVASVDLSTSHKLLQFQMWKELDGSKAGLQRLLDERA